MADFQLLKSHRENLKAFCKRITIIAIITSQVKTLVIQSPRRLNRVDICLLPK